MKRLLVLGKRYRLFLALLAINIVLISFFPSIGKNTITITRANMMEMFSVLPPIFILLGLLDVWIDKETMIKYLGNHSSLRGIMISFLLGSCAAGPLYVAFPIVEILLKKRASLFNIFIFIGAWSTTKIPMFLFETSSMGWKFSILRLCCDIIGIIIMAKILDKTILDSEKEQLYNR